MFGPMGPGPLVGPWVGVWDVAWQSPPAGVLLLACLVMLVMAGISLAVHGGDQE